MAKLRAVLDNLDDLPEERAALYVEGKGDYQGRYVLDVESTDGLELTNAQSAVNAKNTEKRNAKRAAGDAEKLRGELQTANARIEELEATLEGGAPDAKGIKAAAESAFERKVAAIKQEYEAKLSEAAKRGDGYRDSYRKTAEAAALAEAMGGEIRPTSSRAAKAVLRDFMRWEENDDGGESLVWLGEDGNPLSVSERGVTRAGTAADVIKALANATDTASLFEVDAQGGSGSAQSRRESQGSPKSGGGPRVVRLTSEQVADHALYQPYRAQEKAGEIQIQVVD